MSDARQLLPTAKLVPVRPLAPSVLLLLRNIHRRIAAATRLSTFQEGSAQLVPVPSITVLPVQAQVYALHACHLLSWLPPPNALAIVKHTSILPQGRA